LVPDPFSRHRHLDIESPDLTHFGNSTRALELKVKLIAPRRNFDGAARRNNGSLLLRKHLGNHRHGFVGGERVAGSEDDRLALREGVVSLGRGRRHRLGQDRLFDGQLFGNRLL